MENHSCKHEIDLAILARDMADVKDDTKEILKIIKGDNGQGLVTKVAINRSSIVRLWWLAAMIVGGIASLATFIIKKAFE